MFSGPNVTDVGKSLDGTKHSAEKDSVVSRNDRSNTSSVSLVSETPRNRA